MRWSKTLNQSWELWCRSSSLLFPELFCEFHSHRSSVTASVRLTVFVSAWRLALSASFRFCYVLDICLWW
jgi:hypothetical protein